MQLTKQYKNFVVVNGCTVMFGIQGQCTFISMTLKVNVIRGVSRTCWQSGFFVMRMSGRNGCGRGYEIQFRQKKGQKKNRSTATSTMMCIVNLDIVVLVIADSST